MLHGVGEGGVVKSYEVWFRRIQTLPPRSSLRIELVCFRYIYCPSVWSFLSAPGEIKPQVYWE